MRVTLPITVFFNHRVKMHHLQSEQTQHERPGRCWTGWKWTTKFMHEGNVFISKKTSLKQLFINFRATLTIIYQLGPPLSSKPPHQLAAPPPRCVKQWSLPSSLIPSSWSALFLHAFPWQCCLHCTKSPGRRVHSWASALCLPSHCHLYKP